MKKNIGKRILSLALALVMVVGLLPMTAYADVWVNASAVNALCDTYKNCIYLTELTKDGVDKLPYVDYVDITGCTRNGNKVTFEFRCQKKRNSEGVTITSSFTITDTDCSQAVNTTVTDESYGIKATFRINRSAKSHTGGTATCVAKAKCSACGKEYGDYGDHSWSDWTTSNGRHIRTCILNTTHTESGNCDHKPATCLAASACSVCKKEYAPKLEHNYIYTADGSVLTEKCSNGCGHSKTATLQLKSDADLTYTGSPITPMEMVYPEGWAGEEKQPSDTDYTNNVNAGTDTASCSFTYIEGATVSNTFTIEPASLSECIVTMTAESGIYNGSTHNRPDYTLTYKGKELEKDTNYYVDGNWAGSSDFLNAGNNILMLTGKGNFTGTITLTYTIHKATPTADLFEMTLPQNPVYDGTTPFPVNVTTTASGMGEFTVKYNGSEEAPINAGTYKVTVDVAEGTNYNEAASIELGSFTVAQDDGSATVSIEGWEYGDTAKAPVPVSSTNGTDHVTYQYKVKGADDTTYVDDVPTAVGEYTVKATFAATQNHKEVTATADFTISKRTVTVTADNAGKTYGGADPETLTWTVTSGSELANEKLAINISRAAGDNAGDYSITVSQTEGANPNYDITFVPGTFTIHKASLTVTAENKTATYGDAAPTYTVTYSGFVNGDDKDDLGGTLAFDCDYAQFADKGTYTITPKGYESGNYDITFVPGTLTVNPKAITVTIADKTSVYGEEIVALTAADNGIVNGDTNVYSLATTATKTSNVGEYDITGTALDGNYDITFVKGTYTITKANAAFTAPTANTLTYNGVDQTLIAAGSTDDGTMVYSLEKEGTYTADLPMATTAGKYNVWYKVNGDKNHNDSTPDYIEVEIYKADPAIGTVTAGVVNDTLETSAIVLTRANTTVPGNLTVDAGQTLALGENKIAYTFTPDDTINYKVVTGEVTVTVKDTIAPTGTVTVSTKSWAEFLNNITFGLFFKETQTVSVTATDNLSGVAKIEYIESKTAMDLDAVKAVQQWTEMKNGSVSVTLEDTKQFIYYIRITDKSGNVAYLSSDGAEYDTSAPVIEGVSNGATYYTTQTVTVTDKNIDSITLNGEAATGTITLEGNKEATYTIVATDKAGNSTTVTVTMKPIKELAKATENLGNDNVTSANTPALEALVEKLDELLADDDVTDGERETLEQHKTIAESLIQTIEDTAAEQKAVTDKAAEFDEDKVKSTDKAELERLAEDIEALLDTNNLTQDERTALETLLEQVEGMTDTIDKTAADSKTATDAIAALDPETVKSTDKAAVEAALETIENLLDGDHLTETERKALEDAKADAEALLDAIEEAAKAADTENTAKVEDVTADNVTPEDKSDLEKAKADLEKALEDNSGNYTEEEKKAIEDEIARIDEALQIIENVEAVEDTISDLPATVEPDDEETVAKIEDAKKAYDELTEYEKSLVDEDTKEKLDDLTAAAVAYKIVKGDGGKWTKGSTSGLSFTANGPLGKFSGIEIDGKVIDAKCYDAVAGSTVITLKASYLETLSTGKHTITVVYTDGEAEGTFKINAKSATPATGDDSNIMLYGSMFTMSLAALVVLLLASKKRKQAS